MADRSPQQTSAERLIILSFAAMAVLLCAVAVFAAMTLNRLVAQKDAVILDGEELAELEHVRATTEREARLVRGWLLTRHPETLPEIERLHQDIDRGMRQLDEFIGDPESRRLLAEVRDAELTHRRALSKLIEDSQRGGTDVVSRFEEELVPVRARLDRALDAMLVRERTLLHSREMESRTEARWALGLLVGAALISMLIGIALLSVLRGAFRVQAQQRLELHRHIERTESANRDLDAFAGRIAHDLKNALGPALLAITRLQRAELGSAQSLVARVDASLRRSVRILDGLLAFARAGARSDPTASCDVRRVLDGVLEEVEPARAEADALFVVDAPAGARAQASDALLHAVMANLIGNALKYVRGRPVRRVRVTVTEVARDKLRLAVEDSGPGVSPEYAERIFDAFYRVPGQTVAGTGIGLATVKRIVEAHGGTVRVGQAEDGGAKFEVTLPAAPRDSGEVEVARSDPTDTSQARPPHA